MHDEPPCLPFPQFQLGIEKIAVRDGQPVFAFNIINLNAECAHVYRVRNGQLHTQAETERLIARIMHVIATVLDEGSADLAEIPN